jgi:NhaP-type Na+/H+ or K+/H+ antiporter
MLWMFPGVRIAYMIRTRLLGQRYPRPSNRTVFVLGWTGMRGVLALAAAFSLPRELEDGSPFPQRDVIIFLTFAVILVTLVLQGLTLPTLIRKLGLCAPDPLVKAEREARRRILQAALDYLESVEGEETTADAAVWQDAVHHYRERYALFDEKASADGNGHGSRQTNGWQSTRDLNARVRAAERVALAKLRAEDVVSDHVLRKLERELDLLDIRFVPPS